ncbi:MAG TPA: hypothetical protein VK563_10945 [Puia sp.]|nr:hypothetical protein [Puia sp.]
MLKFLLPRVIRVPLTLAISLFFLNSCYSYRVATKAQAGAEINTRTANSFFWGLVQKPQEITTPICDSLNANGMAEVVVKTNFGYSLITVLTLGIWCPMKIEWKCSKPCQVVGHL